MLSREDRERLDNIARRIEEADPAFAAALGHGRPRRPRGDRRWPLVALIAVAASCWLSGLAIGALPLMLAGAVVLCASAFGLYLYVRRSHGRATFGRAALPAGPRRRR